MGQTLVSSPLELQIAGIPTVIVDDHNEVLPFWSHFDTKPFVLLHVDAHHDLWCRNGIGAKSIRYKRQTNKWRKSTYTSRRIDDGNFICWAVHQGIVGAMYHYNPRNVQSVAHYGTIELGKRDSWNQDCLATRIQKGRIVWDRIYCYQKPEGQIKNDREVVEELSSLNYPLILDIDLDAFFSLDSLPRLTSGTNQLIRTTYLERIAKTEGFLRQLPKPELITIARSHKSGYFTPKRYVRCFQKETINFLTRIYS